jgi:F0F1-type ATP synthase assembly protein I
MRNAVQGPAGEVWRAAWRDALRTTSLGWDLALPIAGGVWIGHVVDQRLQSGMVWTVALLFLGVVIGYANVLRSLQEEIDRDQRRGRLGGPK